MAVIQLQSFKQDEATRKRFKALAHVPIGATFALAELDLSNCVSAEVLQQFGDEIGKRAQARARRKAEEERAARADAQRSERERRKHGKTALAIELEMLRLTPAERERREQQLLAEAPEVKVSGEWQDRWQQRESERQQLEAPSFARLVAGGFAATGPAVGGGPSPEYSVQHWLAGQLSIMNASTPCVKPPRGRRTAFK